MSASHSPCLVLSRIRFIFYNVVVLSIDDPRLILNYIYLHSVANPYTVVETPSLRIYFSHFDQPVDPEADASILILSAASSTPGGYTSIKILPIFLLRDISLRFASTHQPKASSIYRILYRQPDTYSGFKNLRLQPELAPLSPINFTVQNVFRFNTNPYSLKNRIYKYPNKYVSLRVSS